PQSGSEFFSAFAPDLTPVGEPPHHLRNCRWNDFHDFGPDLMESVDHLEACQTIFRHEPDTPVSSPMPEAAEHTLEQGFLLFGAQKPAARVLPSADTETQADVSPDEEMVSLTDAKDLETDFSQTLPAEMAEAATPLNEENGAVTTADMEALLSVEVPIPPDASGETGMAANMVVLETS
ncbi:MAG: hypothetical protein J5861_08285, partial [Desulfovibrio sp.]|nr:hypothetical protein [Desulfovibrio sp.]